MKFRKSSTSSPKMELLSRRSSGDRMSTLKRSRSFRASLKLMSKLRSHAGLRLNAGLDLSPMALRDQTKKHRSKLSQVDECSGPARNTETRTDVPPRDEKALDLAKDSFASETESRKITKELRTKLCLTDRITRKICKDEKSKDPLSPKVAHIFRWKSNGECPRVSCEEGKDTLRFDNHVSYENPTFCLDSSLDSSVSSFLFEPEDHMANEDESKDESSAKPCQDEKLTMVVDSRVIYENKVKNSILRRASDDAVLEEETFECNKNQRPLIAGGKGRSLSVSDVALQDEERGSNLDLDVRISNFDCREEVVEPKGHKAHEIIRTTSVCSSKSCRIRTVDNIANFWTYARGSSFRSKVSVGRKKSIKDAKDHESIGQDRVPITTTSGSSTGYQGFH